MVSDAAVLSDSRATIDGVSRWVDGPLVGRVEELGRLMAHVERAAAGRSSAVLLAGDAGVGKTRLLDELGTRAVGRGFRVLTGHCVDLGEVGLPYLPFVDLLRPVGADPELAPESARNPALAGMLAGRSGAAAPVPPVAGSTELGRPLPNRAAPQPVDDGRLQLFESVAGLLTELAAAQPLLVVLEDIHWADQSSRDLLRYLLSRLVDAPIAVVASYRSDDLHRRHPLRPLLAELVRLPGVERLDVAPLADAEVGALVRGLADGVAEATVAAVVARAEGNAFYAEELLAAGPQSDSLPWGLSDVLLARVERCTPEAQQVLRIAAVAGRTVRHELLAAVGALTPEVLDRALAETVHSHLLVVSDDGRYRFRHALLREAVLADLLPGERVRVHASIAAYLAATPGAGTAVERAHHARASNDLPGALTASLDAADEACRMGAPAEQLMHLEAALAMWRAVPSAAELAGRKEVTVLVEAAAAARTAGEFYRCVALLRSALEVGGAEADPLVRARLHYTLAQALLWVQDPVAAHRESGLAMALAPADPPSEVRTWAAATHARVSYSLGSLDEGDAAAEEALATADALGLDSAWSDTAVSQIRSRSIVDPDDVRRRLDELLARAVRSGDLDVEMRVLYNLAIVAFEAGRVDETLAWAARASRRAYEAGIEWSFYAAELRHLGVTARYVAGDWDGSLADADQLARVPEMAAHVRAAGLLVLVGRGDPTARARLEVAEVLVPRRPEHVLLGMVTAAARVDLAAWEGDPATAVAAATDGCLRLKALWPDDHLGALRLVATALAPVADAAATARLVGDAATAERWVAAGEDLVTIARSAVTTFTAAQWVMGVEATAWLARVDAEEARLHGSAAPDLWRAAVAGFDFGHVYEQARSRWRLAEALMAVGDRAGAAEEAGWAHEVAVRLGASPLRAAVEALVRRGRLDVEVGEEARVAATVLTPRESEVLALLGKGRTNRQIGAELYISEKTASVHVSNIIAKFAASGRTEAVAIAAQRGLLAER
jgi:DNA-binding CsgD family transcriptional regulator/tetratricopeptide (TPR) repeat protein